MKKTKCTTTQEDFEKYAKKEDFEKYAKLETDLYNLKIKIALCVEKNIEEYLKIIESASEAYEYNLDKIQIYKNFIYVKYSNEDMEISDLEIPVEFLYNQEYRLILKDKLQKEKEEKLKKYLKVQNKINKKNKEKELLKRKELFLQLKQEFEPIK